MKKASISSIISTALLCFVFWLLITGELAALIKGEPSVQVLAAGAVVSILVACFSARFFIHERAFYLLNPKRFFTLLFYAVIIFPIELIKANLDVAFRALNPKLPIKPGIVKVPVYLKSEYAQSMLANSITLTPGTITVDMAEEDGQLNYYIHWIDVKSQEPKEAGDAIKGTLENWVRRIWE